MSTWTVKVYYTDSGQCPFRKWHQSNAVTKTDRARFDARVDLIQQFDGPILPPKWLKKYETTVDLKELVIKTANKQLRPLCYQDGKNIIILCGAIEKDGKILKGDLERAQHLSDLYKKGIGYVEDYYED